MNVYNLFKFISKKYPENPKYSWEKIREESKENENEIPSDIENYDNTNGKNGKFERYKWTSNEDVNGDYRKSTLKS